MSSQKRSFTWRSSAKPHITLNDEFYGHLAPFRLPLILTILIMLIGTVGYMVIDKFPLMDAIYQTGITFTTVGYGEIRPISDAGRIFTISLIIFGFVVFSIAVGIIAEVVKKGELQKTFKERRMLYKIARLTKHFVICYHNDFTIEVTKQLRENHIPFVVVDPREDMEAIAKKFHYPYFVSAEPHTEEGMLKSFLSSAKGVISLSENIADNIAVIASARLYANEIGRSKYLIITNAKSEGDSEKLTKLGANSAIVATNLMARRINSIAIRPDMENMLEKFIYRSDTPLDIEEVKVSKISWLVLKRLKEIKLRDLANVTVLGITPKEGQFIPMPKGDTIVMPKSRLILVGTSGGIKRAKLIIKMHVKPEELRYV